MRLRRGDRAFAEQAYKVLLAIESGEPIEPGKVGALVHYGLADYSDGVAVRVTPEGERLLATGPDFYPYD